MRTAKAEHKAARKSCDGRVRFVVQIGTSAAVFTLHDFAQCPRVRIRSAYSCGKLVGAK